MTKVTTDEVATRLDRGDDVTVIDARAEQVWNEAETKARGAIRIPPDAAEEHITDVSREDYLVIYCT
jgi:hypothetical protein